MPASMHLEFKFANLYTGHRYPNVQRLQIAAVSRVFAFYYCVWKLNVKRSNNDGKK